MKRNKLLLVVFFVISCCIFAQKKDFTSSKYFSFIPIWTSEIYVTPDYVFEWNIEEQSYHIFDRSAVRLDQNGYLYFGNKIFIPGLRYCSFDVDKGWIRKFHSDFDSIPIKTDGLKYEASSFLTEKNNNQTIKYSVENLTGFFGYTDDKYSGGIVLFDDAIPWVEGVKGYGVGEYITITKDTPFNAVEIINGYVDLEKLDLYKKNSRVKTFKVLDLDNNEEYQFTLEDIVEIQKLYLKKETKSLKLIIEDVYKGDKWDDTCISYILPIKEKSNLTDYKNQTYTMFSTQEEIQKKIDHALSRCE